MKNYYINLYPAMNDFLKLLDIPFENNLKNDIKNPYVIKLYYLMRILYFDSKKD